MTNVVLVMGFKVAESTIRVLELPLDEQVSSTVLLGPVCTGKTLSADSFSASPDPDLRPLSWHQLQPSLGPDQRAFSIYNVRVTKSTKEKIAS